jgi:peptidoglycan/LPS O-acetylase OafA/YrhL
MRAQTADVGHSASHSRIDCLDGWRGIAVLLVLLGHFLPIPGINNGRVGVELFFVLSGRLMVELLFFRQQPLGLFFRRRISRVWPALFVFVAIMAVAFAGAGKLHVPFEQILGAFTFTSNYVSIYASRAEVVDHLWSLSIEEWSYVVLAAVALCSRAWGLRAIYLMAILCAFCIVNGIIQSLNGLDYYDVYWRTDVRASSILLGGIAYYFLRDKQVPGYVPLVTGIVGYMLCINPVPDMIKYTVGSALLAVAGASIEQAPAFARKILENGIIRFVGLMSFSLYLWQQPFFKMIGDYPRPLLVACTLIAAAASYYLVENPARTFLNRRWASVRLAGSGMPSKADAKA